MLAGPEYRISSWNGIGNAVNLEMNAHTKYDKIEWAIQANEDHGKVRI